MLGVWKPDQKFTIIRKVDHSDLIYSSSLTKFNLLIGLGQFCYYLCNTGVETGLSPSPQKKIRLPPHLEVQKTL